MRRARAADADAIFELLGQLTVSYVVTRDEFDALFVDLCTDDRAMLHVVELDGRVRGYALTIVTRMLHVGGESAQLQELVVDADHRGAGLGTALLEAVESDSRARGVRQLVVASRRASQYYSARGFVVTADYLKRVL